MKENEFLLELCSDVDFEEMVADISYNGRTVGCITQDSGVDKMEIEFFFTKDTQVRKFQLEGFEKILKFAKKTLIKSRN